MLRNAIRAPASLPSSTGSPNCIQILLSGTPVYSPSRRFQSTFPTDVGDVPSRITAPFPIFGFIRFVPEKQACVVERFGRFSRVLNPGLNFTIPMVESVAYTHSLKELTLPVNTQQAITRDNVTIRIDGVLYVRVIDAVRASYGVDRPLYAVMQLAQTSMRSELGKMTLDNTFEERDALNDQIVRVINAASKSWGLECLRYEIKDILPPPGIVRAMELQAEAERRKRAQVLESEGVRQATINESEAKREAQINTAIGESETITRRAKATADSLHMVGRAINDTGGSQAVAMHLAQQYVDAFGRIAKAGNTMILPADAGNVASMVAQATSVFSTVSGAAASERAREGEASCGKASDGDEAAVSHMSESSLLKEQGEKWEGSSPSLADARAKARALRDQALPPTGFSLQHPPPSGGDSS